MSDRFIQICSAQLESAARAIRRRKRSMRLMGVDVMVSAAQLETAARILKETEPSICNGDVRERPGFIHEDRQDDPNVLVFDVGILPSTPYRIGPRGKIQREEP